MTEQEILALPLFSIFSEDEKKVFFNFLKPKNFTDGQPVFNEGDPSEGFYITLEGNVQIRSTSGDTDVSIAGQGTVFGEMALIAQDTRSATIVAVTDCLLLEINRNDFLRLVENSSRLGVKVLMNIARLLISRLRQSSKDVISLTTALSIALSK